MGLEDQIKQALSGHEQQVDDFIDKVGDFIDDKTGGKFKDKVDEAQAFLKDHLDGQDDESAAAQTPEPAVANQAPVAEPAVAEAPVADEAAAPVQEAAAVEAEDPSL